MKTSKSYSNKQKNEEAIFILAMLIVTILYGFFIIV